jgi:hypothetical protein
MVPKLPPYTTDTTQTIGTNAYPQLQAILGAGYQGGLNQEMGNIGSLLKGQIPTDVMTLLGQQGAERGIAMGSPGSPNANAATLRALGLTSLGLEQQGIGNLSQVIQQVPIQQTQTGTQTTDLGAARAGYAAAPDPNLAAQQALKNAQAGINAGRGSIGAPSISMPNAPAYQGGLLSPPGASGGTWYPGTGMSPDPYKAPDYSSTFMPSQTPAGQDYSGGWEDMTNWGGGVGGPMMQVPGIGPLAGVGPQAYPSQASMWGDPWSGEGMSWGQQPTSQGNMFIGGNPYDQNAQPAQPTTQGDMYGDFSGGGGYTDDYSWLFEGIGE